MSPYNEGKLFGAIGQSGDGSSDLIWDKFANDNLETVLQQTGCVEESNRLRQQFFPSLDNFLRLHG